MACTDTMHVHVYLTQVHYMHSRYVVHRYHDSLAQYVCEERERVMYKYTMIYTMGSSVYTLGYLSARTILNSVILEWENGIPLTVIP